VSAFNVVLVPSRYARGGVVLLLLMPLLILAALPLPLIGFIAVTPCLLGYYLLCYTQWQQLQFATAFTLNDKAELFWHGENQQPAQLSGGLISEYAIQLRWQQQGDRRVIQRWVFADQCDDNSFRALARAVNQLSWQAHAPARIN
jgi:hypothetical protein